MPIKEYKLDEISVGLSERLEVKITQKMIDAFVELSGDDNPLHTDPEYCRSIGFAGIVVHGCLTASFISTLVGKYLPGKYAQLLSLNISWNKPVFVDDVLTYTGTVSDVSPSVRTIEAKVSISNTRNEKVASGKFLASVWR